MKYFLFILIFLIIPFFIPTFVYSQSPTSIPTYSCKFEKYVETNENNIFKIIWNWITWLFEKPYDVDTNRSENEKTEDFSNYGNVNSSEYENKHSYVGSRTTVNNTQDCLKGKIIKDVLLDQATDKIIGKICLDNSDGCNEKKISDLALYLIQTNQQFICNDNDTKIDTPSDLLAKIETKPSIPSYELPCYSAIYDDFF